ncbi:ankyrin repeat and SOCS box protein 15 isoform X1 [Bufo gargarizans]|uniref:ankyrin repeat and SOCS box protein 15 isoform X1 n=1 Tax=Bufo gargarizans TaxID=30331 RepID=UPI001CF49776|nr:ankyrin repeat and SOCS box protein 15 isoform X1 [Bufo gargarizans]XP_044132877.1 ankyrin repeat and SOCS box protein 15 isoform X1 [Bufo gargarizans]
MEETDEDQLDSYEIQLGIQESLQAITTSVRQDGFVPPSDINRKIVTAIKQGEITELQKYIQYKYALDEADEKGWFPIHVAVVQPVRQITEIILDAIHKTQCEQKTNDGETPLTLAAKSGLVENVKVLLEKGVWPNTKNSKGESPLLLAVRIGSYDMVSLLISYDCTINQPCVKRWSSMHEAAKQGHKDIISLLLKNGGNVNLRDGFGVTPLGVAAEFGQCDVLEQLIHKGGEINIEADDGSTVLADAATGGNPDCIALLLEYGASGNMPDKEGYLPIHKAAYGGHYLALKYLIPVTSRHAIKRSGLSPIHSAVDGQSVQCLELLIENDFDVNDPLAEHLSENYGDKRMTALFFAVSNTDVLCTEILLKAGANPNLDTLNCLLVAVRSGSHEIVRLLLVHNANVNCYFMLVNDTHFPSAIQYALNDEIMLRMLLNNGYQVERCFDCMHGDMYGGSHVWKSSEEVVPGWTSCVIKDTYFCDFITVSWMRHLVGKVIRVLVDYMDYVPICTKLKSVLEVQKEWVEIQEILGNPRPLKHLCRLKLRKLFGLEKLQNLSSVKRVSVPPLLKSYLLYKEYDLYGKGLHFDT